MPPGEPSLPDPADYRTILGRLLFRTTSQQVGHEWDLRAAPTNVRSSQSNGLNADVAFGPLVGSSEQCRRDAEAAGAASLMLLSNT
jgi:hypothetical protein